MPFFISYIHKYSSIPVVSKTKKTTISELKKRKIITRFIGKHTNKKNIVNFQFTLLKLLCVFQTN